MKYLRDGEPCNHKGCLSHISHPCEGCGRIAGRIIENSYKCPLCGEMSTFEIINDIDLLPWEKRAKLAQTEGYIKLLLPRKLMRFSCGCITEFKEINFDKNHKVINIKF
jgi:hypothetical protein